jgi:elongation factor Ts
MAEITAQMVKELRERTGAGMMDCKNALVEASGDTVRAVEIIQKRGLAKAVKAAGRIAADGMIVAAVRPNGDEGVLVEVNCQTDFVARGQEFQKFAQLVGRSALEAGASEASELEAVAVEGKTLREHAEALTAKTGEKHAIRRVAHHKLTGPGVVTSYIHHGARLGVLVEVGGSVDGSRALSDEIALQVASMGPRYVRRSDVPQQALDKQREIFSAQMKTEDDEAIAACEDFQRRVEQEGGGHSNEVTEHLRSLEKKAAAVRARPEAAKAKILDGKLAKWLTEIVLLDQASVKEEHKGKTIAQLLEQASAGGSRVEVRRFARFELGEGIERGPTKDFATEVAELAAASQKT